MIWVSIHLFFRLFCVLKISHNFKRHWLSISSNPRADSPHLMFLEISIHLSLFDYFQKWRAHYHGRLFRKPRISPDKDACYFLQFFSLITKRAKRLKEKINEGFTTYNTFGELHLSVSKHYLLADYIDVRDPRDSYISKDCHPSHHSRHHPQPCGFSDIPNQSLLLGKAHSPRTMTAARLLFIIAGGFNGQA